MKKTECRKILRTKIRMKIALVFLFMGAFTLFNPSCRLQAGRTTNVLILHSYHKGQGWNDDISRGLESALKNVNPEIELHYEYMDAKRHHDSRYFDLLHELYRHKFSHRPFDIIISSDDHAFRFLLGHHRELFPDIPVVFCGVNQFEDFMLDGHEMMKGVLEPFDVPNTIAVALQLHPETRRVFVIVDKSLSGTAVKGEVIKAIPAYRGRIEFIFLEEFDTPGLLERVKALPGDSIVLLVHWTEDKAGEIFSFERSCRLISQNSSVPVYSASNVYLDHGIVGGRLSSGFAQGKMAAEIALGILGGTRLEDIPAVKQGPSAYEFDYRDMRRFGITLADLPKGSHVIHKPHAFYSIHKTLFWGGIGGLVVLVSILLLLAFTMVSLRRNKALLEKSEMRYRTLVETMKEGLAESDANGQVTYVNRQFCRMLGYTRDELIGHPVCEHLDQTNREILKEHLAAVGNGPDISCELELCRKDGRKISTIISPTKLRYKGSGAGRRFAVVTDITDRKRAEENLRQSEERYRLIFEQSPLGIMHFDDNGVVFDCNSVFAEIIGTPKERLIGFNMVTSMPDGPMKRAVEKCLKDGQGRFEGTYHTVTGDKDIHIKAVHKRIDSENGTFLMAMGVLEDVSERIQREQKLRKNEERLKEAQETAHLGFWERNLTNEHLFWSDETYRIYGFRPGEVVPSYDLFLKIIHPEDRKAVDEAVNAAVLKLGGYNFENRIKLPDGEVRWIHSQGKVIRDHLGKAVTFMGTLMDITERKRAEEALMESEGLVRALLNATTDSAILLDSGGTILAVNQKMAESSGKEAETLIGTQARDLFDEALTREREKFLEKVVSSGEPVQFRDQRDGMILHNNFNPVFDAEGNVSRVAVFSRDVTREFRAENARMESEKMFRMVADFTWAWEYWLGPDGKFLYISPSCERITGYPPEAYIQDPGLLMEIIHPADREYFEKHVKDKLRPDQVHRFEFRLINKHGDMRWIEHICRAVRDEKGKILGRRCSNRDISIRKRALEDMRRFAKRLVTLREIDSVLLEVISPEEIAHSVLQCMMVLIPSGRAAVLSFDFEALEGTVMAHGGDSDNFYPIGKLFRLKPLQDFTEKLRSGEIYQVKTGSDKLPNLAVQKILGIAGRDVVSISIPLLFHGDLIGAIVFDGEEQDVSYSEHIEFVKEVGRHLAVALKNAQLFRSVSEQSERLRELATRLEEAEENERGRLARELHDQVGANLATLNINLNLIQDYLEQGKVEEISARLDNGMKLVEETTRHIRNVMTELRPSLLDDYGLPAALRWWCRVNGERTNINTIFEGQDLKSRLPRPVETNFFRIAQEALTNCAKHSGAAFIRVILEEKDGMIRMTVNDNGKGFNPQKPGIRGKESGWGMIMMEERARAINGRLHVNSVPGKGCRIITEWERMYNDN